MRSLEEVLNRYRNHPEFLGIELARADQRGAVDDTPLHIAARLGEVDDIVVLVSHGADVNCRGDLGNTPLHQAALAGKEAAVRQLLLLGSDESIENEFGESPLKVAELGGHRVVVSLLKRSKK